MSHIIIHSKRFWFVHNPKVGGSSLRVQIGKLDETGKKFFQKEMDHPELGPIFLGHLPLKLMRDHFPEDFERISDYETFVFVRDPMDRFRSAYAQHSKQFKQLRVKDQTSAERASGINDVVSYLRSRPSHCRTEYCHFQPQIDFVALGESTFVKHVYLLSEISEAFALIERQIDVALQVEHKNSSRGLSPDSAPELYTDSLAEFVRDYYAEDYALYNGLIARNETPALAAGGK